MRIILVGYIMSGLLISVSSGIFIFELQPVPGIEMPFVLDINKGTGFNEIANQLEASGIIRSKFAFKIYSILTGRAHRFQNGRYRFVSAISIPELTKIISDGPFQIAAAVFPGMTLKEADDRLAYLGIIEKGQLADYNFKNLETDYSFLKKAKSLEGFLLPDTYYFYPRSESEAVVNKIIDNFETKVSDLIFSDKDDILLKILIIASLLEKEIPSNEERQIAAGILNKRLKAGMPLQVDASIIYAKCSGRYLDCPPLSERDYQIRSPYNTYLYAGLPPAPISNPSLEAISAVLQAKDFSYWYYLSDPKTKKTIFSKNLDEHNRNRAKYLLKK